MPDLKGAILFFEESGGSVAQVESQLEHLSQLGLLAGIKGLLFGRPANFSDHQERGLADVLRELGLRLGISVVMDVDFGHTDPRLTLPIGVRARLDGQAGTVTLLDPAVA
jgi:muramoyltetrapeptide carboxypeptidase LdcA involved in peptidoglycan recycling